MIHIQQVTDIERLLKMRMEVLKCVFELPDDYDMTELFEANRKFYQETLDNGTHVSLEAFYVPDNKADGKVVSEKETATKSDTEPDRCSMAFALSEDEDTVDPDSFMDDSDYMEELELEEISATDKDDKENPEERDHKKDPTTKGYLCASADLCFYKEMPSPDNPSGDCAYIMNVYVRPKFRAHGIASKLVKELIRISREQGAGKVYLESTKMAKPLYQSLGFCDMEDMMHLPIQ